MKRSVHSSDEWTKLQSDRDSLARINKTACRDWSEDHTHLQALCRKAGASVEEVEGGDDGMLTLQELADLLESKLRAERDQARKEGEAWYKALIAGPDKVLRCAFCGKPYPEGTPDHKHERLAEHIRVCKEHPVGKENRDLRAECAAKDAEIARFKAALNSRVQHS